MRVTHLTLSTTGGAGTACLRLHAALCAAGLRSKVRAAVGPAQPDAGVTVAWNGWRWRARFEHWRLRRYPARRIFAWWSDNVLPTRTLRSALRDRPDLVHLHWLGDSFVAPAEIALADCPLVWTLHDAWPVTGGCHYPGSCERFATGCGRCPQLGSTEVRDASAANAAAKGRAWRAKEIAWVSPSSWLAGLAERSAVLGGRRVRTIANGLDVRFGAEDFSAARSALGIARDETAFLAGIAGDTSDRRKGVPVLAEALHVLARTVDRRIRLVVFGGGRPDPSWAEFGIRTLDLGRIGAEDALRRAYSAADALVLPSLQDNLPNTALEAIACGCPVLGLNRGGLREIVEENVNGFLADEPAAGGLAAILARLVRLDSEGRMELRRGARRIFLERFRADERAQDYLALYRELVGKSA